MENGPELWANVLPRPDAASHKYDRGYCTIFGAPSLTGATRLAATAANRVGAGLVTVQCETRGDVYRAALPPEIMVQDAGETIPEKTTALLGGPGGLSPSHLDALLSRTGLPRVIDSGGFPSTPDRLNGNSATILTPHEGEFSKLFGPTSGSFGAAKAEATLKAAQASGAVVVLKGPLSVIAHPDGRIVLNDRPNPYLATAGTGDVLAGLMAGLLAQHMDAFWAASAAVWIHSEAAERIGPGLIASDITSIVPNILAELLA